MDNTKRRADGPGGLEGRVSKRITRIFGRLAGCTEDRAGWLDNRAGQWATHKDLGQLSRQLHHPPVGSNTDVGETQTRHQSEVTLNWLNQY